jgi:hypothetical protein
MARQVIKEDNMTQDKYNFNLDLSTEKYEVKVDTASMYGYFERKSDGSGGGLWFGSNGSAGLELTDYDGVAVLPKSVAKALRDGGFFLDETFD